jgi:hypothetical protein
VKLRAGFHQVSIPEEIRAENGNKLYRIAINSIFYARFRDSKTGLRGAEHALISDARAMKTHVRSTMNASLKVILTAVGVAVLASPVMAQPDSHRAAPAASVSNAHGSASQTRTKRAESGAAVVGSHFRLDDCVHVTFPQCGDDATLR